MAVTAMHFLGFGYFVMVLGVTSHNGVVVVIQFFQWHFHCDTDIQFSFSAFVCIFFLCTSTSFSLLSGF
ncbi:hypothetical protein R3W88_000869 [Solanum pinnatisectum]|uniref:Uncharacterized protein n=1 Tax=Solanum pinnatisectum TaxID=50273 RepID=A0AAV9MKC1_9SOLN|nr:hypothetical protein R3W88_000869 [Solanum pinnatisectum]